MNSISNLSSYSTTHPRVSKHAIDMEKCCKRCDIIKAGNHEFTCEKYVEVMSACNWGERWVDKILIDNNEEWIFVLHISEFHDDRCYDCGEIVEICVPWWWFWFDDSRFHMIHIVFMKYISKNENLMNIFMKNFNYNKYIIILDLFYMI